MIYTCMGCNSGQTTPWCTECEIKKSCRDKGFRTCIACGEFPCDVLTAFINDPEYPYHQAVPDMMRLLNEIGLDAWAAEMEKQYTCGVCGEKFTYFDMKCPRCSG